MSRLTRIALAIVISIGVVIAVFASVGGSSVSARQERSGSHLVSGSKVNLDHYREAAPAPAASELQSEFDSGKGRGCESESQNSPLD